VLFDAAMQESGATTLRLRQIPQTMHTARFSVINRKSDIFSYLKNLSIRFATAGIYK
jgi:hypothetical protein